MNIPVLLWPEAACQIDAADAWWQANRAGSPTLFIDEVRHALKLLAQSPDLGRPYRRRGIPGLRRLLLVKSQYHIYYLRRPAPRGLVIVAVWSAVRRRGPPLCNP